MGIYDSIISNAPNSAMDETDFKKFKSQSQSQQKSNRELSAGGGGQNTMATAATKSNTTTRITFSVYDSINL